MYQATEESKANFGSNLIHGVDIIRIFFPCFVREALYCFFALVAEPPVHEISGTNEAVLFDVQNALLVFQFFQDLVIFVGIR